MFTLPAAKWRRASRCWSWKHCSSPIPRCAAGLARGWSDARCAARAERLRQNYLAENAAGAGAGRLRRCPAVGERRLSGSTSDAAGSVVIGDNASELDDTPLDEGLLRTRLAQLQLGADKVNLPLAALSGGERLKAAPPAYSGDAIRPSCCCSMSRPTISI